MSLVCSHCHKNLKLAKVSEQRGQGFNAQIRCYHCEAWLGKNANIAKVKMVSFYVLVIAIAISYFLIEYRTLGIVCGIVFAILLMISHFMDHLFVVEAPDKTDDSEHLQKYR
ncbi:MAG: hypothetical protein ACPGUD_02330 [Parashewanella sp.]